MHLIVTRPFADARPLAQKLEAMGQKVTLAPMLEIKLMMQAVIPQENYQAVVLTSANAVRALEDHEAASRLKVLPTFVVGPQSFEMAHLSGFKTIEKAAGDARSLASHVMSRLTAKDRPILYLSGYETAADIAGTLRMNGFRVERVVLYHAEAARHLPKPALNAIQQGIVGGVLLYSQRTAKVWTRCIAADGLQTYMEPIIHFCLSASIGKVLTPGAKLLTAKSPEESSMLELIATAVRERNERILP